MSYEVYEMRFERCGLCKGGERRGMSNRSGSGSGENISDPYPVLQNYKPPSDPNPKQ